MHTILDRFAIVVLSICFTNKPFIKFYHDERASVGRVNPGRQDPDRQVLIDERPDGNRVGFRGRPSPGETKPCANCTPAWRPSRPDAAQPIATDTTTCGSIVDRQASRPSSS